MVGDSMGWGVMGWDGMGSSRSWIPYQSIHITMSPNKTLTQGRCIQRLRLHRLGSGQAHSLSRREIDRRSMGDRWESGERL